LKHKGLTDLIQKLPSWAGLAKDPDDAPLLVEALTEWLLGALGGLKRSKSRVSRDSFLVNLVRHTLRRMRGPLATRLQALQFIDKESAQEAKVMLSTFHGSKGLEFDNVWMLGLEEKVIPSKKSPVEEERRLFYVAGTRARDHLYMSCHGATPSQFLYESFPAHADAVRLGRLEVGKRILLS
jgi:superfamily I DNA/RNA helicase